MIKTAFFIISAFTIIFFSCNNNQTPMYSNFEHYPVYEGNDLEMTYTPSKTLFRVWTPVADEVKLRLYDKGLGGTAFLELDMNRDVQGTWVAEVSGDQKGKYYTFQVHTANKWLSENPGLYAITTGANGRRAQIIDLKETNPAGWDEDKSPALNSLTDIIIYEMHVRDLTISPSSGASQRGKYLGIAQTGTTNSAGDKTGLDHIKDLGVTHVHLLPSFDFRSVDETETDKPNYNWGYDPQNYNTPEGSYSSNPHEGMVRVKEFKQMVKTFHDAGIRVVMDVVYNHTGYIIESNFNQLVPKYYYRLNPDSSFSNASGCGNETASERYMVRKYMIESLKYWATEYHIDGFRFDLMGIHDIETMNLIRKELHAINPMIVIYGEGWTAGDSPLPIERRALKNHVKYMDSIAVFSDDLRDAIKGSWMNDSAPGFLGGGQGHDETIKFGIVAATQHPQINYSQIHGNQPWANDPWQVVNYVTCHDNHTLWDRNKRSFPKATDAELRLMQKLGNAIVLTSQGIAFIHAGSELARTKQGVGNSYKSPDSINQIDWERKTQYQDVFKYYKTLIALRKSHPAFRMPNADMIRKHLSFIETGTANVVAYCISNNANGDAWKDIIVVYNGSMKDQNITVPQGNWTVVVEGDTFKYNGIRNLTTNLKVPKLSMTILVDTQSAK